MWFSIIDVFWLPNLCGASGDASFAPELPPIVPVYFIMDQQSSRNIFLELYLGLPTELFILKTNYAQLMYNLTSIVNEKNPASQLLHQVVVQ